MTDPQHHLTASERYLCPRCGNELERVKQSYPAMLNADQFEAIKAGDWYCEHDRMYWWQRASGLVESQRQSRLNVEDTP